MPLNNQSLFAEEKSDCSLAPKQGAKFKYLGPDSFEFLITVKEFKDNDNFLKEKIGLLKLRAAEEFMDFLKAEFTGEIKRIENKKGELIEEFFTYKQNFDWNDMKPILISMKSFHCYDKGQIIVSGKWTSNSLKNAYRHIDLEKAWDELLDLDLSISIFEDKKLYKKFPKLDETDDPEYVRNAIKYVKRLRGL